VQQVKRLIEEAHNRLSAGDHDRAAEIYHQALEIDSRSAEAHYGLGLVHWRRDVSKAEYWASITLLYDRDYFPAKMLLSNAYFARGLRSEAWFLQREAFREVRDDPSLVAQLLFVSDAQYALVYEQSEFYPMAELYLRDALKDHSAYASRDASVATDPFVPFLADAHHTLARVLQRQRKIDEARWHYQRARQIDRTIELDVTYREIMSDADLDIE
jgi:tetratricopeptide (TPR) repeat protein